MALRGEYDVKAILGQLPRKLRAAAGRAADMTSAWASVGEVLLASVRKNFDAGGRPTPWLPLKSVPSGRNRSAGSRKILVDSARLMRSISYSPRPDGLSMGTNVVYGATHQFGRGSVPARPFLVVQSEDEPKIVAILERYLVGDLR
jgi:phage virion morphogenesis protein